MVAKEVPQLHFNAFCSPGHDLAELFWIESGHGVHEIDPRSPARQVDLGPGLTALVGPGVVERTRTMDHTAKESLGMLNPCTS